MIRTGVSTARVDPAFAAVVGASVEAVIAVAPAASVYLYGSVATGQARVGSSDVDLLAIGLDAGTAHDLGAELGADHERVCRSVEIAAALPSDLDGDGDEAYGFRVFLRHYCLHLVGLDQRPDHDFPADGRAARGLNGDIARHRDRWRRELAAGADPGRLATQVARKSLLAVAGLVSVHGDLWTTDRATAATRWADVEPEHRGGLRQLLDWVAGTDAASATGVDRVLRDTIDPLVDRFAADIGLWGSA